NRHPAPPVQRPLPWLDRDLLDADAGDAARQAPKPEDARQSENRSRAADQSRTFPTDPLDGIVTSALQKRAKGPDAHLKSLHPERPFLTWMSITYAQINNSLTGISRSRRYARRSRTSTVWAGSGRRV